MERFLNLYLFTYFSSFSSSQLLLFDRRSNPIISSEGSQSREGWLSIPPEAIAKHQLKLDFLSIVNHSRLIDVLLESPKLISLTWPSLLWTRIFHVHPHSIGETRILLFCEKLIFGKKSWSRHLFYFIFKGENKTRNKTLKNDSIIFGKSVSLKNPNLSPGIRLPIGKVPLKGSTPLSPIKVSTN